MDKIKNRINLLTISLTFFVLSFFLPTMTLAAVNPNCNTSFLKFLCSTKDAPGLKELNKVPEVIKNIIISIGGILTVLAFVIGGLMYITSAGNNNQTDKAKKVLTAATIGLILIISARAILGVFVKLMGGSL